MLATKLSVQQINYVNIGLMIVSAASALMFPFETFLFVYAFLGPLHYLTEISWLHDRQYFTKGKFDYIPLLIIGVLITFLYFGLIPNAPEGMASFLTYMAFAAALVFVTVKKPFASVGYLAAAAFAVLPHKLLGEGSIPLSLVRDLALMLSAVAIVGLPQII